MHRQKLLELLKSFGGKIFWVQYIKKDGTFRNDNVRLSVRRHVKGTGKSPSKPTNDIVTAYRMFTQCGDSFAGYSDDDKRNQYFCLKLSRIVSVKCGGKFYHVTPSPIEEEPIDLFDSAHVTDDNIISISA